MMNGRYTVIVDAGHGGRDPGAVAEILQEAKMTLTLSEFVIAELRRCGINAIPTRTSDVYVNLIERVDKANKENADLFLSLHGNSSDNKDANYISTFILSRGGEKERAAKLVQKEIVEATGFKDGGVKIGSFYVLRKTKMPAIIVEAGFISNKENKEWLLDNANLQKLSKAIARGVCNYFGIDYKEGEEVDDEQKPSEWAKRVWEDATEKGYTDGTRPKDKATREEVMAMIYKVLDK